MFAPVSVTSGAAVTTTVIDALVASVATASDAPARNSLKGLALADWDSTRVALPAAVGLSHVVERVAVVEYEVVLDEVAVACDRLVVFVELIDKSSTVFERLVQGDEFVSTSDRLAESLCEGEAVS